MTNFVKANFEISGDYVHYTHEGVRHFIARFKHNKKRRQPFLKFLVKNITVEEYIEEAKNPLWTPMDVVRKYGYVEAA